MPCGRTATFKPERGESLIRMYSIIKGTNVTSKTSKILIPLMVAVFLLASGCILGYNTGTPADTVNSYFDAVQWLDIKGLNELVVPSQQLDDDALDALKDNTSGATGWLREWQITVNNRTITVLEQNDTHATVNASADVHVSVMVRSVRESNQTHIDAIFSLELVDTKWLVSACSGTEPLTFVQ